MEQIIRNFYEGGFMMYVIGALLIIALIIILERFYFLFFKASINAPKFMEKIFQLYREKKINEALAYCNELDKPLTKIISAAVQNHESMDKEIQNAVDEVFLQVAPKIKKNTPLLSIISQVATILGLLGTIIGLMESFTALSGVNPALRTEALASGISKAMVTTAFGLIVAGICIFAFAIFNSKIEKIVDDIDEFSVRIINHIKRYR